MAKRASGLLLHVTSLPGPFGVGDLGPAASAWLEWLARAGQRLWQILPLGPVGPAHSPYDAQSSFAGNPLLISPQALVELGLLDPIDLDELRHRASAANLTEAAAHKSTLLRAAWDRLRQGAALAPLLQTIRAWVQAPAQQAWLADWSLYAAIKESHGGASWVEWPAPLRQRQAAALARARDELRDAIGYQEFLQFLFFDQLARLRAAARMRQIGLVGDLPFYPALDSCDVWTHADLFDLDAASRPRSVGGVPPDYFSDTGQRWGNPSYLWNRHREQGYRWWSDRLEFQLRQVDALRLDHFRGFAACWQIPATAETAAGGSWQAGPGIELFDALRERLAEPALLAEDLGVITPDVEALRRKLNLPGMRVLQFAFDSHDSPHLPHNLTRDQVLYTGTHDNDTSRGWFDAAAAATRRRALDYLGATPETFGWELLRAACTSVADWVVIPAQDLLGLDSRHRMNIPGTIEGNWLWRLPAAALTAELAVRLRRLTEISGRLPEAAEPAGAAPA